MKCKDTGRLMVDKLAGELSMWQAVRLNRHLAKCESCRREYEELSKIWQFTGDMLKDDEFAEELTPARCREVFEVACNKDKRKAKAQFFNATRVTQYLVVFLILFVISGMLLPALNTSREKARRISDESYRKQLELEERLRREEQADEESGKAFSPAPKPAPELVADSTEAPALPAGKPESIGVDKDNIAQIATDTRSPGVDISNVILGRRMNEPVFAAPVERRAESYSGLSSAAKTKAEESREKISTEYIAVFNWTAGDQKKGAENKKIQSQRAFKLNLKLWNMTTDADVRQYLRYHNYPEPAKISVNKTDNLIIMQARPQMLEKIAQLFDKLRQEEKQLDDLRNGLPFINCASRPLSTFSIDTDTASYVQARKFILLGERPDPLKIRPEEFINYFNYNYRSPQNAVFAVYPEAAPSPFRPENILFRIAVQGKRLGPDAGARAHYTILLDTSGSMAVKDRMALARKALGMLFNKLKASDYVSLLLCGNQGQTVFAMRPLTPENRQQLLMLLDKTSPHGIANFADGIFQAYAFADKHFKPEFSNKVVIISDGIFELNMAGRRDIASRIEAARKRGISNIVIGLGGDGDDDMLEKVAALGDGSYVFLDTEREAEELFSSQFEARFREIARDVKIQVEFNPAVVKAYRQIGYKNRQLSAADFRDDKVDAGEVGSGQSVTALYELKLKGDVQSDAIVATVRLRYRKADDMSIEEKVFYLYRNDIKEKFAMAGAAFQLAACVAEFAEALRYPETKGIASLQGIENLLNPIRMQDYHKNEKVIELLKLIKSSK